MLYKGTQPICPIITVESNPPVVDTLTVTPSTTTQTITPPTGTDGYNTIKVSAVTSAIDSDIVASNIKSGVNILGISGTVTQLVGQTMTVDITSTDTTSSIINVFTPSSGYNGIKKIKVRPTLKPLTITPTTTTQTFSVPSGYSGFGAVTCSAGTTPTLITKTITTNGTYNASSDNADGYSSVSVNVAGTVPSGTYTITANGTYDVTNYASADVNVSGGGGGGDWQPDPDWWNIETILTNDERDYAGKAIILYSNSDDFTEFTIASPTVAVATSDGAFYTSTATHTWDRSKDKVVTSDSSDTTPKYATRYVILYFNSSGIAYTELTNFRNSSIYAVFKCDLTNPSGDAISNNTFFYNNRSLQSFKFLSLYNTDDWDNYEGFCANCYSLTKLPDNLDTSSGTSFSGFCANCYSLTKLPDNLDTSSGTSFDGFCQYCYSLVKLPDNLDISSGISFSGFCRSCYSLTKLPDNLDTSGGTSFAYFCQNCYSLVKLPDNLDISSSTSFSGFCQNCYSLVKANIKLASVSVTTLSNSTLIDIQSLQYIANNAPTISAGTIRLTIGSTNIARAGGASGTIITTLTSKGWTVN